MLTTTHKPVGRGKAAIYRNISLPSHQNLLAHGRISSSLHVKFLHYNISLLGGTEVLLTGKKEFLLLPALEESKIKYLKKTPIVMILYAGELCYFWGFLQPCKAGFQVSKALGFVGEGVQTMRLVQWAKCPKPFPKHFIVPDTISLIVTHNSIKGLPTQIAICSLTPAWQGYYMELVPLNRADKARCHPCQHTSYIRGNLRTFWLKEIFLLPTQNWQQKCLMAVFSVSMTVTVSAIFVREVAEEGQEIDCHSALAILQKEPCSEGCTGSLREGR